jgi:hypothetical protein
VIYIQIYNAQNIKKKNIVYIYIYIIIYIFFNCLFFFYFIIVCKCVQSALFMTYKNLNILSLNAVMKYKIETMGLSITQKLFRPMSMVLVQTYIYTHVYNNKCFCKFNFFFLLIISGNILYLIIMNIYIKTKIYIHKCVILNLYQCCTQIGL